MAARDIAIVVYDRHQLLDLAGPLEVFDAAARITEHRTGTRPYRIRTLALAARRVRSSSGLTSEADGLLASDAPGDRIDTLVVVGGEGSRIVAADHEALELVRAAAARSRRVTSVCTGALVLAAAGLLDGYEATTHWAWCDRLAERAEVTVLPDRIYVRDRDRWTSAGVTAGIDLALALVEDDLGVEVAHQVAGHLVVFARRPGGQAQFSVQLRAQAGRTPAVVELLAWLPDHLDDDLTVDRLAARAAMSPRTFARTFRAEVGTTPAVHVESLRVEAAKRLLSTTDLTVDAVAAQVGLGQGERLHRAFGRRVGTTPARYRQHFSRTAS
ncbi:MAG: DJ-1/PfpI family protein [Actinobacteria bacterium]|nr:DJ-1/PfpI family protein [Actinomycetota bacterium]